MAKHKAAPERESAAPPQMMMEAPPVETGAPAETAPTPGPSPFMNRQFKPPGTSAYAQAMTAGKKKAKGK
jgi:hypothetical protein